MAQFIKGGFLKYGLPPSHGTSQFPVSSMVTAGNMRRASSPFSSMAPKPGKYKSAQKAQKMANACLRFTAKVFAGLRAKSNTWLSRSIRIAAGACFAMAAHGSDVLPAATPVLPVPVADHVVLIVWDGMRPDFISEELTPNLHALAQSGTFFAHNHSAYITSTEVNGTVLATGVFGNRTTIIANREYRPNILLTDEVATEHTDIMRVGDALSDGLWIAMPTVAELLHAAGHRTIVAGTKGVGVLHDRASRREGTNDSPVFFAGRTYPKTLLPTLEAALGPWPGSAIPNDAQNLWTTNALIAHLWTGDVPKYSVLWLSDPDYSQHGSMPGSQVALAAIRECDRQLGMLLEALRAKGIRDKTDIILTSDHGFSTVDEGIHLAGYLRKHGLQYVSSLRRTPRPGDVLGIHLGGTFFFYVVGSDPEIIKRLVVALQQSDFAGPIFTRDTMPGTFPFREVAMDSPHAPDVAFSFRWHHGKNEHGAPGCAVTDSFASGFGSHASASKYDIHNTLVAAGPDFRSGFRNEMPTGNVDVVPTILHLLRIQPAHSLDGRVLAETLKGGENLSVAPPKIVRMEAASGDFKAYLQFTDYAGKRYLDEGNRIPRDAR